MAVSVVVSLTVKVALPWLSVSRPVSGVGVMVEVVAAVWVRVTWVLGTGLSWLSRTVRVTLTVLPVSVLLVALEALRVEWVASGAPGVKVMVAGWPIVVLLR